MAAAPWYRAGTVNVANGSTAVVGVQTAWKTSAAPLNVGDVFLGPDGKLYEVESITTDTALVLKAPYQGANANGAAYAVIHNFSNTLPADLYGKLSETLQQYHLSWDEFCTWATATGNVTFTNIAGGVITLPGLVALTNALNGRTVKNITGGATVTLTAAEAQARLLDVTGSGNNTLKVPAQSGMWAVSNLGSGTLTVLTAAANSTGITLAAGKRRVVTSDGANISYAELRGTMADQDANNVNTTGGSVVGLAVLNTAGNVGVGVAPSPWWGGRRVVQLGGAGGDATLACSPGTANFATLSSNMYIDASLATRAVNTGPATAYTQGGGAHGWSSAPSVSAGSPLSLVERMVLNASGNLGIGTDPGAASRISVAGGNIELDGFNNQDSNLSLRRGFQPYASGGVGLTAFDHSGAANDGLRLWGHDGVSIATAQAERMRIDSSGSLLVGVTSGANHIIQRPAASNAGDTILSILGRNSAPTGYGVSVHEGANTATPNAQNAVVKIGQMATAGRSLNAAGTLNATGADYAEYERNNGLVIQKGALVGFKADGTLTLTHAEAIRFGIKSTDPSYVGGDTWGSADAVGARPAEPLFDRPAYQGVSKPDLPEMQFANPYDAETQPNQYAQAQAEAEQAHQAALAAYESTLAAWMQDQAAYQVALQAAQADHDSAMAVYQAELAAFEARLEAARLLVDRVAYSGKVPVNIMGCTPGGYVLAAAGPDGAIVGEFVADPDFAQYKRAVGRVNRILPDGRAEVAVIVH